MKTLMNNNLLQLISKTITVWNVFETISKKWNITDWWWYLDGQLFNFYPKDYSKWYKQLFIDINLSISDLNEHQIDTLNDLLK